MTTVDLTMETPRRQDAGPALSLLVDIGARQGPST